MTIPFTTETNHGQNRIKITVLDYTDSTKIGFRVKKSTKIGNLKRIYAKRTKKSPKSFKLTYKGKVLKSTETFESLNMTGKNNILIKATPVPALGTGVLVPKSHNTFVYQWPGSRTEEYLNNPVTPIRDETERERSNEVLDRIPMPDMDDMEINEELNDAPDDIRRGLALFEGFEDFIR